MNKLVNSIIFVFLFTFSIKSNAQLIGQERIDSLSKALIITKDDIIKMKILFRLSSELKTINPDDGIKYGLKCLELIGRNKKFEKLTIETFNCIGANYESKADYPNAIYYYFKAIDLLDKINLKNELYGNILSNIGNLYFNQTDYNKALNYYFKALSVFENKFERLGYANTLNGIATVYSSEKNYDEAEKYYNKAIAIDRKLKYDLGIATALGNIGDNYKDQKNYTKALEYYKNSLQIYESLGDDDGIGTDFGSIGTCFLAMSLDSIATIGKVINEDTLKKAINYLNYGIALSKKVDDITNILYFSKALGQAYHAKGDYKNAFEYNNLYLSLHDSVFSAQNNQKIISLELKREHELKEKLDQFNALQTRNERAAGITGIVLLLIIIIIVYNSFRRQKKYNKLLSIEKNKSDSLLLNILPYEVAEELKETGIAEAKFFDNVTVLFTDFVGFSTIASNMSPKALVAELHICFKKFDEIISKYNIEKIKTIGDAYMAISGLPLANPNHALDIVQAAIEINQFITEHQHGKGELAFRIRIGIHTGNVVAGIVGVRKFAYDVWGDTVNTAARMEQNSLPGKINISETTYNLINKLIACTYRGEINAKNKGMLKMYFVNN